MKSSLQALTFSAGALLASQNEVIAQVSLYEFDQTVETYTEIGAADGGYVLGTPVFFPPLHNLRAYADPDEPDGTVTNAGYLDPAIGPGYPIGFDFTYNGEVFDRIGIAHGGWISFGKSSDGDEAVNIFTSDHPGGRPLSHEYYATPIVPYKRNRIAGLGLSALRQQDQSSVGGLTSEFRVATIGTTPNRVCVIQWKDFRYSYSNDGGVINFQIRLNEVDNSVDVRFGEMTFPQLGGGACQIGLGGQTNADYNNRLTAALEPSFLYDWNQTVPGVENTSSCTIAYDDPFNAAFTAAIPVAGLNFRWTPPTCPPPAWPVDITEIRFDRATVGWSFPPTAEGFEYVIATIDDPSDPNAVVSGNTEEVGILVEGLQPLTNYFVFVRSQCGGEPGPWSNGTRFRTNGGAVLQCGEPALEEFHCSGQNSTVEWRYNTSDGVSPVRISFQQGYVGSAGGEYLKIFNGPDENSPLMYTAAWGDVLPGQVFTSSGSYLFMKRYNEAGSCESQPWYTPWIWTVGCRDCTEPLAAFAVVNEDCEDLQYEVQVTLVSMGTAEEIIISNSQGVASETVSATGTYVVGPFTAGLPVTITVENPDNALCNVQSIPLVNAPCAILDCGPTEYELCHDQDDQRQWLFQGEDEAIGVRFYSGDAGFYVQAATYDALDPLSVAANELTEGSLRNVLRTSTNPDNALVLEMDVDQFAAWTCVNGLAEGWHFVVACYDGCTQPQATFAAVEDCDNQQFNVSVNITEIGSAGSVVITNDGGAATVNATAAGTYTVGPFASQDTVTIEVEGASVLCSWTSQDITFDCTGVGIEERVWGELVLFPNPTDGTVRMRFPMEMQGDAQITIHDVSGRVVSGSTLFVTPGAERAMDWSALPSGVYTVSLISNDVRHIARINIAH